MDKIDYSAMTPMERTARFIEKTTQRLDEDDNEQVILLREFHSGMVKDSAYISLEDLKVLYALAADTPDILMARVDGLVEGYQKRIKNQIDSINRLLKKLGDISRIAKGGGSSNGKIIEIRKIA